MQDRLWASTLMMCPMSNSSKRPLKHLKCSEYPYLFCNYRSQCIVGLILLIIITNTLTQTHMSNKALFLFSRTTGWLSTKTCTFQRTRLPLGDKHKSLDFIRLLLWSNIRFNMTHTISYGTTTSKNQNAQNTSADNGRLWAWQELNSTNKEILCQSYWIIK